MIELRISDDDSLDEIVAGAPCVPHVGSRIDTSQGIRIVMGLHYDYHPTDGCVRVYVRVAHMATAADMPIAKHRF